MARPRRPFPWVPLFIFSPIILPLAVFGGWCLAVLSGLAVVHDTSGQMVDAVVVDSLGRVPMRRLAFGLFIGRANTDGDTVLSCRDGSPPVIVTPPPGAIRTVDGCRVAPAASTPPQEN